jgi:hypothetical protein
MITGIISLAKELSVTVGLFYQNIQLANFRKKFDGKGGLI